MKDIIVVCAGTYGREAISHINEINARAERDGKERPYNLLGVIDDNLNAFDGTDIKTPIIGRISDWKPLKDERYIIGSAVSSIKEKLTTMLKERGCVFETLIAPYSRVSEDAEIGEGCFISAVSVSAGVKLGDFVNINGSMITPGAVIGDYSTTTGFSVVEAATIGKSVFVGSHAVVASGVTVGDGAKISVGSMVTEDVPAGATVFGMPAKQL